MPSAYSAATAEAAFVLFVSFVAFVVVFDRLFSRQAGIQGPAGNAWVPAFAGMTNFRWLNSYEKRKRE